MGDRFLGAIAFGGRSFLEDDRPPSHQKRRDRHDRAFGSVVAFAQN
ncbi:hypothetical protein JJD41_20055 [Oxynema sp. CENA135]|nr:hypothetical protein [Oxynema sp. CENA135]MBK4732143.1 hypothetical protein [Oxynema sp. CENA135]